MSDVGQNLRWYLLDDPAIGFQLGDERIHQNKVPQEVVFPFISYFRRGTQDEHTTDEVHSAQPFRHLFDLECVSDDIDQALDLAELVKSRLGDRAAYSDSFGQGAAQAVLVQDHDDDYIPRSVMSEEGLHVPSLSVEIIPR